MLLFSSKIIGRECDLMTEDATFCGVVRAVHDEWVEVESAGEVMFLNGRHIVSITIDKDPNDNNRPRKRLFGKNKTEEGC
ncbi:hypothetical protein SAMN02910447_01042 [Ruminococcus sp. YE71]|uniref:hypothetical protein n=1 Tax=unclassified Ruminococcus TaxID=2608920 RepID=UPI000889B6D6|nr:MULTISPECIES: hypothetical protein [unclassified Ruminococcus]SDA15980.1 hypothetical protein SAMN02910446_01041 [Ruminococcus sp. YE78]SFW23636.1 hypothetical protein SAMN02910447_01042 [Ruminococcus sp. YE71]